MLQCFPSPGSLLPATDVHNKVGGGIRGSTEVGGMGYCSGTSRGNYCANTATRGHRSAAGLPWPSDRAAGMVLMRDRKGRVDVKDSTRGLAPSSISCGNGGTGKRRDKTKGETKPRELQITKQAGEGWLGPSPRQEERGYQQLWGFKA